MPHVPNLLPLRRYAIRHIPFVTRAAQRYNGEFNCAYHYRHLPTKPCHTRAIRRGHLCRRPQSYCQRSYGMHGCLKARQPGGQIIKFMGWGEENDFKNMDLLLVECLECGGLAAAEQMRENGFQRQTGNWVVFLVFLFFLLSSEKLRWGMFWSELQDFFFFYCWKTWWFDAATDRWWQMTQQLSIALAKVSSHSATRKHGSCHHFTMEPCWCLVLITDLTRADRARSLFSPAFTTILLFLLFIFVSWLDFH